MYYTDYGLTTEATPTGQCHFEAAITLSDHHMYYTDDGLTTEATPTLLYWEEMYSFPGRELKSD